MSLQRSRRLDAEHVQDGRHDVDGVVVLLADLAAGRRAGGPRDDARIARAAVELVALPHLERRVERHRPTVRVVVVRRGAAELVEQREVGLHGVGDAVGELHLVDRSVRAALARGAVVGDHDHEGVLTPAELLEKSEQAPDLAVDVAEEPGVDLGHAGEQRLLVGGQRVPRQGHVERRERLAVRPAAGLGGPDRVDRRQLGVGRDDAHLLLPGQRLRPQGLVPHVEATLVLVDPRLRGVMRRMAGSRRVVQEERLLRGDRLGITDELDRLVRQILREVVALLRRLGLIDRVVVVHQIRIPLVRLGPEEPVPTLEAATRRPVPARRREVHLVVGAQVPLADHVRVPAEVTEDLRDRAVLRRDRAAGVRKADRRLGDARHAVAGVVATGQ